MRILFPALAVAIAAFCVWLGVRIVNRRERWAIELAKSAALIAGLTLLGVAIGIATYSHAKSSF